MRRPFVAGNWKMNTTLSSAQTLAGALKAEFPQELPGVEIAVCPPFPYLSAVASTLAGTGIRLGAQNAFFEDPGAFTGEVAVEMLQDVGCQYVILGHSERRHVLGETDAIIHRKVQAALRKGIDVILCVGELLGERNAGETESVLNTQMVGALDGIDGAALEHVVLAYEPVWAIGTGITATPEQAEETHQYLRGWLRAHYNSEIADKLRILYGGSVKPDNAATLLKLPNVDGALVGGASLKAEQFVPIVKAALA